MKEKRLFLFSLSRRDWLSAAAIVAVAVLVRLLFLSQQVESPFFERLTLDSAYNDSLAQGIVSGEGWGNRPFFIDPLYIYFLAGLYGLIGRSILWIAGIQLFMGSINCLFVYFLGRNHLGWKSGLLAGLGAALYKPFFFFEATLLKSFLAVFLLDLTLLALLAMWKRITEKKMEKRDFWLWTVVGLLLGLTSLSRGNILLFAPFVFLLILFQRKGLLGKAVLKAALCFALGVGCAILPVTLRNYLVSHDFVLTTSNGGMNFYMGNNPYNKGGHYQQVPFANPTPGFEEGDFKRYAEAHTGRSLKASETSRFFFLLAFEWIREEPGDFLKLVARKFKLFWSYFEIPDNYNIYFDVRYAPMLSFPFLTFGMVAPLGLVGLFLSLRNWKRHLPLLLLLLLYSLSIIAFFVRARFRLPIVPILLLFSAEALLWGWQAVREKRIKALLIPAALLCLLAVLINWGTLDSQRIEQTFFSTLNNLGRIHFEDGEYDRAEERFHEAMEMNPEAPNPYFNLGGLSLERLKGMAGERAVTLEREETARKAREYFSKTAQLVPQSSMGFQSRLLLGEVAFIQEEYATAISIWEGLLGERTSDDALIYQALSKAYRKTGNATASNEAKRKAIALRRRASRGAGEQKDD